MFSRGLKLVCVARLKGGLKIVAMMALAASVINLPLAPAAAGQTPASTAAQKAEPVRIALIEGLSGSFANAGEAVYRNILMAVERVNARGGVKLRDGPRPLARLR